MKWRIYYGDGSTRDWQEGLPDTPAGRLGIQVVLQQRSSDLHYFTIAGHEYYLFEGEAWVPIGLNGLEDWTMNCLDQIKCIIKGRAIAHGTFRKILDQAKADAAKDTLD